VRKENVITAGLPLLHFNRCGLILHFFLRKPVKGAAVKGFAAVGTAGIIFLLLLLSSSLQ